MTETEQKEHLKKIYTTFYAQTDAVKDFCEQNMTHIVNLQKHSGYKNTPLYKFNGETTSLTYALLNVSVICKDLLEHIENEIVKLSELSEVHDGPEETN